MKSFDLSGIIDEISDFVLSNDQKRAVQLFNQFLTPSRNKKIFILTGYAGTGKSSLISLLNRGSKKIGYNTRLLSPTGRAAKVLSLYSGQKAHTIHKEIYFGSSQLEENTRLVPVKNIHKNTIFFIDEASMLSSYSDHKEDVFTDLLNYVFSAESSRVAFIGDSGQLPPVGQDKSPALQIDYLKQLFPQMEISACHLNKIFRTSSFSSVLKNATYIRRLNEFQYPLIRFIDENTICLKGYEVQEYLERSFHVVGSKNSIVLTLSNKQANQWNEGIRKSIFFTDEIIEAGDTLLVIKNNYYWISANSPMGFLANGETIYVERVIKEEHMYSRDFLRIEVSFPTYPDLKSQDILILKETLEIETAALGRDKMKELFFEIERDYMHLSNKQVRYREILNNPYFNAVHVKYGYASTVHKAQGGQWSHVYVDGSYIPDNMKNTSYLRWLYTAITRSKEKLFLVNFPDHLILNNDFDESY